MVAGNASFLRCCCNAHHVIQVSVTAPCLLNAEGTNMGSNLLWVNQANDAWAELERAFTAPVFPLSDYAQIRTQDHEQACTFHLPVFSADKRK